MYYTFLPYRTKVWKAVMMDNGEDTVISHVHMEKVSSVLLPTSEPSHECLRIQVDSKLHQPNVSGHLLMNCIVSYYSSFISSYSIGADSKLEPSYTTSGAGH